MNYLAHFHLARAHDEWIVGALLGDFIKGPLRGEYPPQLEQGIRLHRRVDALSDGHPARQRFARELPAEYRRYAAIVQDVCSDYWLSRNWQRFEAAPLTQFAARVYALLEQYGGMLPAPAARMARRLVEHDVLGIYDRWGTVAASLERIGSRLRRANPLHRAGVELQPYLASGEQVFLEFYPELLARIDAERL